MFNPKDRLMKKCVAKYGNWCGPGRTAIHQSNGIVKPTDADIPKDALDAVCWLHDAETTKADTYSGFNRLKAWNSANLNFVERADKKNLPEIAAFASRWWSKRLKKEVKIPMVWDEDYAQVYKPGAITLFKILSVKKLPFLRDQFLLRHSIDESLMGTPPTYS